MEIGIEPSTFILLGGKYSGTKNMTSVSVVGPPRSQIRQVLPKEIKLPEGLIGKQVVIEAADWQGLKLRLPDGTRVRVSVEIDCMYWNGTICEDEDWDAYLEYYLECDEDAQG